MRPTTPFVLPLLVLVAGCVERHGQPLPAATPPQASAPGAPSISVEPARLTAVTPGAAVPALVLKMDGPRPAIGREATAAELRALHPGAELLASEDGPRGADGRWVRRHLLRTGMKYPLVRVEEFMEQQPGAAEPRLLRRLEMVADHVLVSLAPGAMVEDLDQPLFAGGLELRRSSPHGRTALVACDPAGFTGLEAAMQALAGDPAVRAVEPDYLVRGIGTPDDASFGQLWGLHNTGQTGGTADADIDAPEAWNISTGSRSVLVGIIDTGLDRSHPDLAANAWTNPRESGSGRDANGSDDDGNGFIDDWRGWNFVADNNNPNDDHSHGTHVAGTIGAVGNNGQGVVGVCWQVSLVGLKFLDASGSGFTSDAVDAVLYADAIGCDITSNSWGGGGYSQALKDAIDVLGSHGRLFVAAAGNDGTDNDTYPHYPSSYSCPNIIAVGASDHTDQRAWFSCYGATSVDLFAPGVSTLSTVPGGGYASYNGTSMATPHVSGACALMKSVSPTLTASQIKAALIAQVDVQPAFTGFCVSNGRLNLFKALQSVAGPQLAIETGPAQEIGDGDGLIEAGEVARVAATVINVGNETIASARIVLACDDPAAVVSVGTVNLGTIIPGRSVSATWDVQLGTDIAPHVVTGTLTASGSVGGPWVRSVPILVRQQTRMGGRVLTATGRNPVAGAAITIDGAGPAITSAADGSWSAQVLDGEHTIACTATGHVPASLTVVTPPDRDDLEILMGAPQVALAPAELSISVRQGGSASSTFTIGDDGDVPLHWTTRIVDAAWSAAPTATGLWHESMHRPLDGGPAWYYGREGSWNYDTGAANSGSLTWSGVVVPSRNPVLVFNSWRKADPNSYYWADLSLVQISENGGPWYTMAQYYDSDANWQTKQIYLGGYAGRTVSIRFLFDTVDGYANAFEGWYIGGLHWDLGQGTVACSLDPNSETTGVGSTSTVTVAADAGNSAPGIYRKTIIVSSDDPLHPRATLPARIIVTAAPLLALDTTIATDPEPANGNGLLEPGELAAVAPLVVNQGADVALDVTASVSTESPYATVVTADSVVGDIGPAESVRGSQVTIRIHADCPDNARIALRWQLVDADGTTWNGTSTLQVVRLYRLAGRVTVIGSETPVGGAMIALYDRMAISAPDGTYAIKDLRAGTYGVSLTKTGWEPVETSITVPPNATWNPQIGRRAFAVSPGSLHYGLTVGSQAEQTLTLSDAGSLPVDWTATIDNSQPYELSHSDQADGPTFTWQDISTTGTLVSGLSYDGNVGPLPIGFSFPFFGQNFSTFRVCANGFISFTSDRYDWWFYYPIPSPALPPNLIALLHRDLVVDGAGSVRYQLLNADTLVIQYTDVRMTYNSSALLTAQIHLRRDGSILMYYRRVDQPTYGSAGIQNADGTKGVSATYNGVGITVHADLALRFRPADRSWLTFGSDKGVLEAGSTATVSVRADAAGRDPGTYRATLLFSNTATSTVAIPVTMTVASSHMPLATPQQVTTSTNTPLSITLAGNDPDSDPLTYSIVAQPGHGTLSGGPPNVTYTPTNGYRGPDQFMFTVNDGSNTSLPAQVSIQVGSAAPPEKLVWPQYYNYGNEGFGSAVATDGQTIVVGAPGGSMAFVYRRNWSGWYQEASLYPQSGSSFGSAVAVSGDTVAVASVGGSTVYIHVYSRTYGYWYQQAVLSEPMTSASADSGASSPSAPATALALRGDDLVVSVPADGNGHVTWYQRSGSWSRKQVISGPTGTAKFGAALALDGDDLVVGAYQSTVDGLAAAGRVCFLRREAGAWSIISTVQSTTPVADERFGWSVAVDAGTALIGVPNQAAGADAQSGGVAIYQRGDAGWTRVQNLGNPVVSEPVADQFGRAVAVAGADAVCGAPCLSVAGAETGGVWSIHQGGDGFTGARLWRASDGGSGDRAGECVAMAGGWLVIGAPGSDDRGIDSGAVYAIPYNRAPSLTARELITNEQEPITATLTASDADGDPLALTIVQAPQHGTLTTAGLTLTYTPEGTWYGEDSVVLSATDGQRTSAPVALRIQVVHVPHPPVVTGLTADPATVAGTTTILTATAEDNDGEEALTYSWSVDRAPADGSATFSASGDHAARTTIATFSRAGTYRIMVTATDAGGLTGTMPVEVEVVQTATTLAVSPETATVPLRQSCTFTANVADQFGQPMSVPVAWSLASGGVGSLAGAANAANQGMSVRYDAPLTGGGSASVRASAGPLVGSASITVPANRAPVVASLAADAEPVLGQSARILATVSDDRPLTELAFAWTVAAAPEGGDAVITPVGAGLGDDEVLAAFTRAGSYRLRLDISDIDALVGSRTIDLTVQQTAAAVTISPSTATVRPRGTQAFTATVVDQFGQPMSVPVTWSRSGDGVGTVGADGVYTAPDRLAGGATVIGTVGNLVGTAVVTVPANRAPEVTAITLPPGQMTGATGAMSVTADDDQAEAELVYAWSVETAPSGGGASFAPNGTHAGKAATATFTRPGSYRLRVTVSDADGLTGTRTVDVAVTQTATTVTIAPAESTVLLGQTRTFTATVTDQFGQAMAVPVLWSLTNAGVGSLDAAGRFTAGTTASGSTTVRASVGEAMGSALVTVPANVAPTVSALSATPSPVTGTTTTLVATASDDQDGSALAYAWSVAAAPAGGAAVFSANGTNAARTTVATFTRAGDYRLDVIVSDADGLTATRAIELRVAQTATALAVAPGSIEIPAVSLREFSAEVRDQFDQPMTARVAWSLDAASIGAISAEGTYVAPNAAGTATVRATVAGVSATATVTVAAPLPEAGGGSGGNCGSGGGLGVLGLMGLALLVRRRRSW